jgi:hypothetical protein
VHCVVTFVLSHHLYHWQQLVVFTAPTESKPVSVPSTRTVGVNPVAGGGEGGGGLGGGGEGGGGEGGGGGGDGGGEYCASTGATAEVDATASQTHAVNPPTPNAPRLARLEEGLDLQEVAAMAVRGCPRAALRSLK